MNLMTIFLTGLFTGGLTCLAVQGGLLATTLIQAERKSLSILIFLAAKLFAYTMLGVLLGLFGSFFQFSISARVILQITIGIFMIGTALALLDIHPVFRYFLIQPPRFLTRLIHNQSKTKNFFAPVILGAFTVFLPCGTTQGIMALAIGTGHPITAAAVMFSFVLGTTPLFFILGFLTTKVSQTLNSQFLKIAAFLVILLAVFNINNAIELTGSPFTLGNLWRELYCTVSLCEDDHVRIENSSQAVEEATIYIQDSGYQPTNITVKTNSHVTLRLINTSRGGCQQVFTIPKLGLQKIVQPGTTETISFIAPDKPQTISFMCSMGMFRGKINVI